jgi:hypothetical protein
MAKSYDFRITIQKAEFDDGFVTVHYDGSSETTYLETPFEGTLKAAIEKRAELSRAEPRPHVAYLAMRYRNDRAAPGLNANFQITNKGTTP